MLLKFFVFFGFSLLSKFFVDFGFRILNESLISSLLLLFILISFKMFFFEMGRVFFLKFIKFELFEETLMKELLLLLLMMLLLLLLILIFLFLFLILYLTLFCVLFKNRIDLSFSSTSVKTGSQILKLFSSQEMSL